MIGNFMKVLVIDIGGTNVKMLASGKDTPRKFPSGPKLTPEQMVDGVQLATKDWDYETVSIGYPGPILCGQPMMDPVNLGPGWMGFDFETAFRLPVRVINDAAMQALGSYKEGKMLFLGLGTGLGAAVVKDATLRRWSLAGFTTGNVHWSTTWEIGGGCGWDERNGSSMSRRSSSVWSQLSNLMMWSSVEGTSSD
jgi:predicted NBD/HSP70 family sugar kinase